MRYFITLLLALSFSTVAVADEQYDLAGRWGLGLGVGMSSVSGPDVFKNGAGEIDGKLAAGLWARYHLSTRFGLELAYTRLAQDFKSPTFSSLNPSIGALDLSLAYRMWPTDVFHVLLQLGAGYSKISDYSTTAGSRNDFHIKARFGFEYMAHPDWMLSLYGDYYRVNLGSGPDSEIRLLSPMLAVTYYFGSTSSSAAPAPMDADGDGVMDDNDKCPGTIAGTNVGSDGCPIKADSDGDGVVDTEDQCPGTPAGQAVNNLGCAKTEKLEFTLNVQFPPGSSKVDPQYVSDLEKFAEFLKKYPETKAQIEGHTDNTGSEKLNYSISQKRAQAVVAYMVKNFGIDKARLTAKGYGPSQPIADNATDEGRKQNRRVVAHVQQ
ncbi:MAG: OmpA family protein [Bdellovibrionaceae bacterium]|nr:OmpA family protein [Pseudobdellovibrionaceae bacterium]